MREKTFGGADGRIPQICARLEECNVFADVGCDHGYCAHYMLSRGMCRTAVISDISPQSLAKARRLLAGFAAEGRVRAVCCDGLKDVGNADLVLIAGMGGEEMVRILREGYIPQNFVLQPMRNADTLRAFLIDSGCAISEDNIFRDGKFYFIIKGSASGGTPAYTRAQLAFGRDSLKGALLRDYLAEEIDKVNGYLLGDMNEKNRAALIGRLEFLKGVHNGEIS